MCIPVCGIQRLTTTAMSYLIIVGYKYLLKHVKLISVSLAIPNKISHSVVLNWTFEGSIYRAEDLTCIYCKSTSPSIQSVHSKHGSSCSVKLVALFINQRLGFFLGFIISSVLTFYWENLLYLCLHWTFHCYYDKGNVT